MSKLGFTSDFLWLCGGWIELSWEREGLEYLSSACSLHSLPNGFEILTCALLQRVVFLEKKEETTLNLILTFKLVAVSSDLRWS